MLKNLKAEFERIGIKPHVGIMLAIDCSERTARNKLSGVSPFTLPEAVKICNKYFKRVKHPLETLFDGVDKVS